MTICTASRVTSQGLAECHQPEQHPGDHIAILTDPDGTWWVVSWHGGYVSIRTIPERPAA